MAKNRRKIPVEKSRKRSRKNQCERKIVHATEADAQRAIRETEPTDGGGLSVYICPWCYHYHIGHARKTSKKSRKKRKR